MPTGTKKGINWISISVWSWSTFVSKMHQVPSHLSSGFYITTRDGWSKGIRFFILKMRSYWHDNSTAVLNLQFSFLTLSVSDSAGGAPVLASPASRWWPLHHGSLWQWPRERRTDSQPGCGICGRRWTSTTCPLWHVNPVSTMNTQM